MFAWISDPVLKLSAMGGCVGWVAIGCTYCSFHEPCKVETVNAKQLHNNSISKFACQVHETIRVDLYH